MPAGGANRSKLQLSIRFYEKLSAEPLVFFAPVDVVSFAVTGDGRVLSWEPIEEELQQVAAILAEFVQGWASGELSV